MNLSKKDLNKYHFALQECVRSRNIWITYLCVKLRWNKLNSKVDICMQWSNPFMNLFLYIIYLPTKVFKLFNNIYTRYELKKMETEINVLKKELIYVDNLRWNKKDNLDLKVLK